MKTIIVYGRQRGHESKEITERPFSGWMCKGIKCYELSYLLCYKLFPNFHYMQNDVA